MDIGRFFRRNQHQVLEKQVRQPLAEISNAVPIFPKKPQQIPIDDPNHQIIIDERVPIELFLHEELPIGDPHNPQDVTEYEHIIYRSMRERELYVPASIVVQQEITQHDRGVLVDRLCRLHFKLQLTTNTFYRCIGILDRIISLVRISRQEFLIYGCAAMLIASKFDDITPILASDCVEVFRGAFTKQNLLQKELQLINLISFDLAFPTPLFFLTIFLRINGQNEEFVLFSRYLTEICMSSYEFNGIKASAIAASALMLARTLVGTEPWSDELANYTKYSFQDLCGHCKSIHKMLLEVDREESCFIKKKYSTELFRYVALVPIPLELPIPFPYFN